MQVLHVVNGLKIAEGQIPPQGSILGPLLTIFCFHKKVRTYIKINLTCVQSNYDVTLLSVIIAYKSVRQAQYKLYALQCIRKFLAVEKAKRLGTTFINSQFNYLQSLWFRLTTIRLGKGGNALVIVTYASLDCTSLLKRISLFVRIRLVMIDLRLFMKQVASFTKLVVWTRLHNLPSLSFPDPGEIMNMKATNYYKIFKL